VRNLALFNSVIIVSWSPMLCFVDAVAGDCSFDPHCGLGIDTVALPATFTLAAAIGAKALAKVACFPLVFRRRRSCNHDVLCVDKTGTLTQNALTVTVVQALEGFDELTFSAGGFGKSDGGQDSVDVAIRSAALHKSASDLPKLIKFIPFDPATKMSEATGTGTDGTSCGSSKARSVSSRASRTGSGCVSRRQYT